MDKCPTNAKVPNQIRQRYLDSMVEECNKIYHGDQVQGDQLYMAVLFWYLVKRDLSNVRYCTVYVVFTTVTFYKVPEQHGRIYLARL